MVATAVYVGTTLGPVRITRLRGDSGSFSVAMAHGTSRTLPISQHYHQFVEAGTGAVLRVFPRPADGQFRIDFEVSPGREISGDSWQLGAFVAHALLAADAFAQAGTEAGLPQRAIWCTGAMDPVERTVSATSVGAKLMHPATAEVMQGLVEQGVDVLFLVPQGSAVEAKSVAVPEWIRKRVRPVRLADEACAYAGAPLPASAAEKSAGPNILRYGSWKTVVAATVVAVAAVVSVWWPFWAEQFAGLLPDSVLPPTFADEPASAPASQVAAAVPFAAPLNPDSPDLAALTITNVRVVELRAPPGVSCAAVQEGAAIPNRVDAAVGTDGAAVSRHGGSLCGVEFVVLPDHTQPYTLLALEALRGDFADCDPMPASLLGAAQLEREARWRCNIRQALGARTASYRVSVARAADPLHRASAAGAGPQLTYQIEP